ncbi:MAG: MYG1 family protein [Myxococcales bacterium]|nr:MYG1 family protein [Myxococcales bacterium]
MALRLATHNGPFHADDVLAAALVRVFLDAEATVVRTRKSELLEEADVVFDVGGVFDPALGRFDHHQREYQGNRSSAGMVLDWIESRGEVDASVAASLRTHLVDYVDAVDTGARASAGDVPCFSSMVGVLVERAEDSDFDKWYERSVGMAVDIVEAISMGCLRSERDALAVRTAMEDSVAADRRVLFFEEYLKWKPAYFEAEGAEHPTDYVLFPGRGDWRVVTIPVAVDSKDDKRKLPEEWAGLEGEALASVVGVTGARFCHKNRFIAAFADRDSALEALRAWDRL